MEHLALRGSHKRRGKRMSGKRWGLIAIAAVVIGAVAAFFMVRAFEQADTARFDAEVSELAVPQSWHMTVNTVGPVQYVLCLSTNPCPSISRRWTADEPVTEDTLTQIAQPAGLDLTIDGPCQRHPKNSGEDSLCSASGTKNGHIYSFDVLLPEGAQFPDLVLDVRPAVNQ